MEKLTPDQGRFLVKYARAVIESYFGAESPDIPKEMRDLMNLEVGIFVTLKTHHYNDLRGCMGYTDSMLPLSRITSEIALSAALRDRRFHPVRQSELKALIVEVSIVTGLELIKVDNPGKYPENITIGRDGLVIHKGAYKGLLLPQFAVERRWNLREFLSKTCMKAGFDPDCWLGKDVAIYRFNVQVFTEVEPSGDVVEWDLSKRGRIRREHKTEAKTGHKTLPKTKHKTKPKPEHKTKTKHKTRAKKKRK